MSSFSKKRVLEILDQAQEGDNFRKLIDRCLRETDLTIEPAPRFGEGNINKSCSELMLSELPS